MFWSPEGPAARQARLWQRQGRTQDAEPIRRIADQPVALRPAGGTDPAPTVRAAASAAGREGKTAVVDAFLWIKRPGESDGTCEGGPAAPELARNTTG
ncbi:glycoside hydrolase family 6 protein [Streptomyces iakyrus]|uniref:glycoside hydrolase family 6 protein n=1 Tax=Streptomyces iakyrus TaxID=68219 RepID=UPI0033C655D2